MDNRISERWSCCGEGAGELTMRVLVASPESAAELRLRVRGCFAEGAGCFVEGAGLLRLRVRGCFA